MTLLGPYSGGQYDINFWIAWASQIYVNGFSEVYAAPGNDYMPFFQFALYVYTKFQGSFKAIQENIGYLKAFPIAFDMLALWYVYKYIDKRIAFIVLLMLNMLNLAYIYNSFIWEQFDGVFSALNFIAVYYAWKRKILLSVVFYVISFNMKVQAIILLPVIGFFYLDHLVAERSLKALLLPFLSAIAIQFVFLIPFINSSLGVGAIWHVVFSSVGRYPMISLNACTFWDLILPRPEVNLMPDNRMVAGVTFKTIGLILFFTSSFAALFPLLRILVLKLKNKPSPLIAKSKLLLICGLLYMLFYFFNTQMHERYAHPAMIFFIAYGFLERKYLLYILFSLAYFFTLERMMHWLRLKNYFTTIFNPTFIAYLNLVIIVYAFFLLYGRKKGSSVEEEIIKEAVT
ncbi:MAG: hypothetical protein KDC07_12095 [Chitinophagaceae bacterium]|nr:hypothetical protein [Chitinophagaceae bacterium]